jgi:hypothetical protein
MKIGPEINLIDPSCTCSSLNLDVFTMDCGKIYKEVFFN